MNDTPLTHEERVRIARAPITVGILATNYGRVKHAPMPHAGNGDHPGSPVFNGWGRAVGTRSTRLADDSE